jgi:hypothetical protein
MLLWSGEGTRLRDRRRVPLRRSTKSWRARTIGRTPTIISMQGARRASAQDGRLPNVPSRASNAPSSLSKIGSCSVRDRERFSTSCAHKADSFPRQNEANGAMGVLMRLGRATSLVRNEANRASEGRDLGDETKPIARLGTGSGRAERSQPASSGGVEAASDSFRVAGPVSARPIVNNESDTLRERFYG